MLHWKGAVGHVCFNRLVTLVCTLPCVHTKLEKQLVIITKQTPTDIK